ITGGRRIRSSWHVDAGPRLLSLRQSEDGGGAKQVCATRPANVRTGRRETCRSKERRRDGAANGDSHGYSGHGRSKTSGPGKPEQRNVPGPGKGAHALFWLRPLPESARRADAQTLPGFFTCLLP